VLFISLNSAALCVSGTLSLHVSKVTCGQNSCQIGCSSSFPYSLSRNDLQCRQICSCVMWQSDKCRSARAATVASTAHSAQHRCGTARREYRNRVGPVLLARCMGLLWLLPDPVSTHVVPWLSRYLAAHVHAGAVLSSFCASGRSALLPWTALHQKSVSMYHRRCGCGAEQHPAGGTVVRRLQSRFPGRCGVGPPCHQPGTPGAVKLLHTSNCVRRAGLPCICSPPEWCLVA